MPPKYFKHIAYKNKKPRFTKGETSNPPMSQPPKPIREFSQEEWHHLGRRFSISEIYWFMHNNETKVGDFVDKILAQEAARPIPPKKTIPNDYLDDLLRDDYQPPTDDETEDEYVSIRHCITCDNFGHKDDMVKCRKCGYWYHTWCADEPERDGREDPYFSFWLCPQCKPDPKQDPGYKFTYRSKAAIEQDNHYEDTDSEMEPDYKVPT